MEATEQTHEDFVLLRKAEKEIHELAVKISTIEKESNEQEVNILVEANNLISFNIDYIN